MRNKSSVIFSTTLGLALVVIVTFLLKSAPAQAKNDPNTDPVIKSGLAFITSQQQADGGITGFSGTSDPDTTARAVLAYAAAGVLPTDVSSSAGNTLLDYVSTNAISFTHDTTGTLFPGRAGELLAAAAVSGVDTSKLGGMDLAAELGASFQPDTAAYSTTAVQGYSSGKASDLNQAWAILGLSLAGRELPNAATYLIHSQAADGSWGSGDPDTTALAVVALLASRQVTALDPTITNALQFFQATQVSGGGWKPSWDTEALNADSTGWILQALYSAGENPTASPWSSGDTNPVQALMGLQKPEGVIGGQYANTYSTAEAILGLAGKPLSSLVKPPAVHRAGLAVFPGDGSVYTSCVTFSEASLTSLQLLQHSGLSLETATNPTQGTAVCKIGDVGKPSNDCFGGMPNYWSFWQLEGANWAYSSTGADQNQVVDGAVNAWSWGEGNPPVLITFSNICEGVKFVMPAPTDTSIPPTQTQPPTQAVVNPPASTVQSTPAATSSKTGTGTYVVYGSILVVLAALIVYLVRGRSR